MTRSLLKTMLAGSAAAVFATGCLGAVGSNNGGGDSGIRRAADGAIIGDSVDAAVNVKADFVSKVQPLLVGDCGSCHSTASGGVGPGFLAGPDRYSSFTLYPGMIGPTPASSRILLKDPHEDPTTYHMTSTYTPSATMQAHAKVISDWIVEYNANGGGATDMGSAPMVAPFTVTDGQTKTIDLSTLNSALTGTTLTFNVHLLGSPATLIQLSNLMITPSATVGVDMTTPLFSLYAAGNTMAPELVDYDYLNDEIVAYAGTPTAFDPPLDIFAYTPGEQLSFSVATIAKAMGAPDGGTTTGCKSVTTFASAFLPDLTGGVGLNCYSCHKAGGSGNGAFDLSEAMTAADNAQTCATALLEATPATPNASVLYKVVSGGQAHQGGTLSAGDQTTFLNSLTTWLNGEK